MSGGVGRIDAARVFMLSALLIGLFVSSWLLFWVVASNLRFGYLGDFTIFWLVGQNPVDWLYTDLHALPFPYPPSSLWLFKPLAFLPQFIALALWDILGLALFVFACRRIAPLVAIAIALLTYPVGLNLIHGQTGLLIGGLVILGMTEKRPEVAGILLGIAAAIKPQSLVAVPFYLLLHREYRTLLWAGMTGAALVAVSALVFGFTPWLNWLASLDDFRALLLERDITGVGLLWPLSLIFVVPALIIPNRYAAVAVAGWLMSPYTMVYDLAGLVVIAIALLLNVQRARGNLSSGPLAREKVLPRPGEVQEIPFRAPVTLEAGVTCGIRLDFERRA